MSKKIEIEIDDLLYEMISAAVERRNRNIGGDISINKYVELLTEKSFKQFLIEHYDDIFNELYRDIESIDRNLEGIGLKDLFTLDELIKETKAKNMVKEE